MKRAKKNRPAKKTNPRTATASAKALRVAEKIILAQTQPKTWLEYIRKSGRGRWPEAEKKLLRHDDTDALVMYTRDVVRQRWLEAEYRLLRKVRTGSGVWSSLTYMTDVIQGSWPQLRACLRSNWGKAEYAKCVLQGEELEAELLKYASVDSLIDHAIKVRKERWPEIEPQLLKNGRWEDQKRYVKAVVMPGVWQELEDDVLGGIWSRINVDEVIEYLRDIRQSRHKRFEKRLLAAVADKDWDLNDAYLETVLPASVRYTSEVLRGRWPELERVLLECLECSKVLCSLDLFNTCVNYVRALKLTGWVELEEFLRTASGWFGHPKRLEQYARNGICGKLPAELHNRMLATLIKDGSDENAKRYVEFVESL